LTTAECNYTATERECYSVVWAITSLRPYVEGLKFHVRTDHEALRWLLTLTDSSGRLLRWRLRLAEFDFTVTYRPGRVHQVPDALSRLESEFDDGQPVDDDVPTFGDHEAILVTTRRMAARAGEAPTVAPPASETADQSSGSAVPGDPPPENTGTNAETPTAVDTEVPAVENDDEALDDVLDEELDLFDVINVYQDDGTRTRVADVQLPLTRDELLDAQRHDDFCQTVLARQSPKIDSAFFEGHDGLLRRRVPNEGDAVQIVAPQTLRPRILHMLHNNVLSGHPGQTRMYYAVRRTYYWPQMAADIYATVRNCTTCARNRVKLRKRTNPLKLFPASEPLKDLCIDILGPLTKTKSGNRFLVVTTDRFTKLTQVAALKRIDAYHVARAFTESWVFKYGPPKTLISDNGKQFASKFFQNVCSLLGVTNIFTSTYHPQTNGQVERYNRTILAMLRNYVGEQQDDWDQYVSALTYAYNCHVHTSTGTTPFDLVLSRPPPPFSLHRSVSLHERPTRARREKFMGKLETALKTAYDRLVKTQERYKRDFDARIRRANLDIRAGDYVFIDPSDGTTKGTKLGNHALGPYRVLRNDRRTFVIQRDSEVERINSDRVTYAPPPENGPPPEPFAATPAHLAEKNVEGPTFVVDRIVAHRVADDGTLELDVKWYGYTERTWEPRRNVPEELVSRYFARQRRTAAKEAYR